MAKSKGQSESQAVLEGIVISRVLNSPRELVFKAWTEAERLKKWWGPKGYSCPLFVLDLAVGGGYFACMRSPDGRDFYSTGVYREISRPERIVLSDSFADEDGNIVSADYYGMSEDWPVEAMIEVTLDELEGKTNMTIHHWPLPQGRDREMCEDGWNESIDKLETYLGDSEIY